MNSILVAGVGNIFMSDDGFGGEVIRELARHSVPPGVRLHDFGIRSFDLAYALTDGHQAAILVDTVSRGEPPGTTYIIEPELAQLDAQADLGFEAHTMDVVKVLQFARGLGRLPQKLYLVGCEPQELGFERGAFWLSEPVRAAVPKTAAMVETLIANLLSLPQTAPLPTEAQCS